MDDWFKMIDLLWLPGLCLAFGFISGIFTRKYIKPSLAAENYGEAQVRETLARYCENREAHVLSNVTLRLQNETTQIDHILVTTKGIFVIETKHYTGWIFADAKSKFWAKIIFRKKFRFQNPIFQNYKHVNAVQKLFEFLKPHLIHNIVVFSGNAEFKTAIPDQVCSIEQLIPTIEQYSEQVISLNRIQFCVGRLEYMRLELTRQTDIEHQEYLTKRFGQKQELQM
ncbi:nuclease-related domain-containing protein [Legionella spiritensis]|uniref:Nuclease-related domain protein n=1 Tax=Legionella spiritensis TaxID=452 RepID=A0A0W0Z435_LEGSP|nr:nuclease-related domain-containing protein [Legionella spiritensis]KTD63884.1 Nuclease-related domain protein [Legionella spiritensis]SNV36248.1 Nuclease-related domain [Legionella spiritensis]